MPRRPIQHHHWRGHRIPVWGVGGLAVFLGLGALAIGTRHLAPLSPGFLGAVLLGTLLIMIVVRLASGGRDATASMAQMAAKLSASERLMLETGKMAQIGGWELDLRTMKPIWSDEVRRIHEVDDDYEPDLETAIDFYPGEAATTIRDAIEHAIATRGGWDIHAPFVTAKGNRRHVRALGRVEVNDGVPTKLWGVFQDCTEQHEAMLCLESKTREAELARTEADLANRAKSEFLANMSHEIRTPMTAILGNSRLLQSEDLSAEDRRVSIDAIVRNGEHLLVIIQDILDVSKIEAGQMMLQLGALSPKRTLETVVEMLRARARDAGLVLRSTVSDCIPAWVLADEVKLRQVLINLIGNAIKFTERGGIDIAMSYIPADEQLVVTVRDTGVGIPADQIARVFDAFAQADGTVTRTFGGTGLGLSISKSLASLMGGTIEAASVPGEGSTFTLRIKAPETPHAAKGIGAGGIAPRTQVSLESLRGSRVLVAEDGTDNQRLIAFHLNKAGAEATIVNDGQQALDVIRQRDAEFDMVIMDMQMPVKDGYSATRELRSSGFDLPVLALTAHAMSTDRVRCISAGCSEYLTKPFEYDRLLSICASLIEAGRRGASRVA